MKDETKVKQWLQKIYLSSFDAIVGGKTLGMLGRVSFV